MFPYLSTKGYQNERRGDCPQQEDQKIIKRGLTNFTILKQQMPLPTNP